MKKLLAILLAAMMLLSFVACGETQETEGDINNETENNGADLPGIEEEAPVIEEGVILPTVADNTWGYALWSAFLASAKANPEATLLFYQPPMISSELRGKMEIIDECDSGKREIYQQMINAQHDVYHRPNKSIWLDRPAYLFHIEEIYDNSATRDGFGTKMIYPY